MSTVKMMFMNSPIEFRNVDVTSRFAAQLKQLVKAKALPLISAGNISLRRSQVTGQRQKNLVNFQALKIHSNGETLCLVKFFKKQ